MFETEQAVLGQVAAAAAGQTRQVLTHLACLCCFYAHTCMMSLLMAKCIERVWGWYLLLLHDSSTCTVGPSLLLLLHDSSICSVVSRLLLLLLDCMHQAGSKQGAMQAHS